MAERVSRVDVSGALRPAKRMPDGRLRVDALLARTGVQRYLMSDGTVRREYRPPDEVFDAASLATFEGATVTDDHPPGMVTPANARSFARGAVLGVPTRDGAHVAASLVINDADLISKMEAGKLQVSCGYQCELDMTPGTSPDGEQYDAVQRRIVGNHVAIVDQGRAGSARVRMDGMAVEVTDADLSAAQRHALPGREFAVPAREGLPIPDAAHLRAAMARFGQYQFQSSDEKRSAFHRILARAAALGVESAGFEKEWGGRMDDVSTQNTDIDAGAVAAAVAGHKASAAHADAEVKSLRETVARLDAEVATWKGRADKAVADAAALAEVPALKARIAELEAERTDSIQYRADEPKRLDAAVKARCKVLAGAQLVLEKPAAHFDGVADRDIMLTICERRGARIPDGAADAYVAARFDGVMEDFHAGEAALARLRAATVPAPATSPAGQTEQARLDAMTPRERMVHENQNAWRRLASKEN